MNLLFWLFQITAAVFPPHSAVKVSTKPNANEPSVAISLKNDQVLIAGSNLNNVYRSTDGGKTWKADVLFSAYGVYGDPVVVAGGSGRFYYFHLASPFDGSWLDRIVCQRSDDEGLTWNQGTYAGLNGTKDQDKPWVEIIPGVERDRLFLFWTEFDSYGSKDPRNQSRIRFSMSSDNGETWSEAITVSITPGDCLDSSATNEGAVPYRADEKTICVVWAGPAGLVERCLDLITDTWSEGETFVDAFSGGWADTIRSIYRSNGLPFTESFYPYSTEHLLVWSERKPGSAVSGVFLKKKSSTLWNKEVLRVTEADSTGEFFMPTVKVDAETGTICIACYRRDLYKESIEPVLYISQDRGETFTMLKLHKPFFSLKQVFFGDYMGIDSRNGKAVVIYTVFEDGATQVYSNAINLK